MGSAFKTLSKSERAAVVAYARAEYDRLVFQQPDSYLSQNAQVDSDGWHSRLCETIAADPERLKFILDAGKRTGFTLIEMSIVLVIIGLIVGGVLVGQSMIAAAAVRATITQIEKFNTAANTFYGKYGHLPGDIPDPTASNFGFLPRGPFRGQGDGNGIIECNYFNIAPDYYGTKEGTAETSVFWVDLSTALLIENSFSTATSTGILSADVSGSTLQTYMPPAKLGNENYIYVWSGGATAAGPGTGDSRNYFGLSGVSKIDGTVNLSRLDTMTSLTVSQANAIDQKIDDGLPQLGNVTALYLNGNFGVGPYWAAGGGAKGASATGNLPTTAATAGSSTTCYDNSSAPGGSPGVAGANQHYSLEINNGNNLNCALSIRMQAGD